MSNMLGTINLSESVFDAQELLTKAYLSNQEERSLVKVDYPLDSTHQDFIKDLNENIRFFDITKIVLNKNENMRDKLISVFNAIGNFGASLLFQIEGRKDRVFIRIGIRRNFDNADKSTTTNVLKDSILGNFPGIELNPVNDLNSVIGKLKSSQRVVSVTDIAGLRAQSENKDNDFVQGIEKVIEALKGKEYSMLLIADPITSADLNTSKKALEDVYSALVPYCESEFSFSQHQSESINESVSKSITKTISQSIAKSVSHTTGKNYSRTSGKSQSHTDGTSTGNSVGVSANASGIFVAGEIPITIGGGVNYSRNWGENHSDTIGVNSSTSRGEQTSKTDGTIDTKGVSNSLSKTTSQSTGQTSGTSQNIQIKFENHTIKKMLERIDKILERYDNCADVGAWNCAMYCLGDKATAQICASIYRSVIRGENSSLENSAMILWDEKQNYNVIEALRHMQHPRFNVNDVEVTPAALISSSELAIHAGLPNKSIPGIPVIECAEFGRTVSSYDTQDSGDKIELGKIFHMHSEEELPVNLSAKSLCSHTFITGSTGSGKSNTVYRILDKLPSEVSFLVVEPAKGEYKNVFGSKAKVYGANPSLTELLKINPFSFPKEIHVLEHIDRLIEIFNVCWPMYAAMPAVLKDAVEKSYEDAGWDLTNSTNAYGENLYPEFSDVARNIKSIIDSSEYDAENKGAYKGSLLTRLKSLTNGLNGLIFNRDEISNEELFDKNVIVDLSRVGSAETKSLIMGVLVLKLQEYRMSNANGMNSDLKHITVLEEAHNLLKRTSTEQSSESANLIGKSVEMLTNAIAEMRTYGEGFIIADQAPALLDMAVIRNTNTKIIMRLPDQDDRELVGKAANLNDDQITELAKLPCGVAAVYQNEWIEPVLCKVDEFAKIKNAYSHEIQDEKIEQVDYNSRVEIAKILFGAKPNEVPNTDLFKKLSELNLKDATKVLIIKYLNNNLKAPNMLYLAPIIAELFPRTYKAFIDSYKAQTSDTNKWSVDVDEALKLEIAMNIEDNLRKDIRQCIITNCLYHELGRVDELEKWSLEGGKLA